MKIRLNKFLSECGVASRRKSEEYIKGGRVSINGKTVSELSIFIDEEIDTITLDGERIKPQKKVYFLLNKPSGFITTTDDEKGRKKVTDLIKTPHKIFPVGRLDYNTTGVLILTNDGNFSNFISHPSNKVPREYKVILNKYLEDEDRLKLLKGILLDGRKSKFEEISFYKKNHRDNVRVKTTEGRNHFVKNMFERLGYFVAKLERIGFGSFHTKGMPIGAFRIISHYEIEQVYKEYAK